MSAENEKKEGSCCAPTGKCCNCKKTFVGILIGLLIAFVAHAFFCGGGLCHKSKTMCPLTQQPMPVQVK